MLSNGHGYPVWQGTFLPFGEEYNPQITDNHYKFTGKERDSETGMDYFGARYYSNGLGRFITPDWAARPTAVPYAILGDPQTLSLYAYVRNNPLSRADADGHCADHYKDGTCKVNVDPKTGDAGAKAAKQLEGVLNKYDKAVNALNDKDKFNIKDSKGNVIGSMSGKEIKAVWNGTSFTVTDKSFNNGGAGGGTSGTWKGDSFSGQSKLNPQAISAYANAAFDRKEAPSVGLSTLTFHELGHETHFGEALTQQYPVTPTIHGRVKRARAPQAAECHKLLALRSIALYLEAANDARCPNSHSACDAAFGSNCAVRVVGPRGDSSCICSVEWKVDQTGYTDWNSGYPPLTKCRAPGLQ